ncbi:unnamed protein product [Merluccius merluccius]
MITEGFQLWVVVLALGSVHGYPTKVTTKERSTSSATEALERSGGDRRPTLEELQGENLLQTLPHTPSSRVGRWSKHRSQGLLPQPEPKEDPQPFVLDLRNFPDLANADLGSQNPNIQVTIEVVDEPQTEAEVEMDLVKDGQRNDWSATSSSSELAEGHRKLFWPLFWEYPEQVEEGAGLPSSTGQDYGYDPEDPVLSGVGGDWESRWNKAWDIKENSEYEEEWSHWSPCSITCGQGTQKRLRSCGYACTATESRTCDLDGCADDMDAVTYSTAIQTTNSTNAALDTNVDSCEKWLSCKNDFLKKYLYQVLTELPSCPCIYPSEVVYSAINMVDPRLHKTYRWRDASGPKERLDIYKPSARFCLRSMLSYDSTTLAAQHCCYDDQMRLITRGKGAGAPNLISTEFSPELHHKVDVLPWILCKGDWSLFHSVRPPNNGLACTHNPGEEVYQEELREAREY